MSNLNLSRQSRLVPEDKINEYDIKIYGIGSVGSHVAKTLAKTGFTNIEVFDMDTVEEENLAAQAFDYKHLKMNKVDAIKDIIKEGTDLEIETNHGEITPDTAITPEPKTIYCCFFDSFEARKLLFDKVKEYSTIFVDGRIGGFDMRYYVVNCANEDEVKAYDKTLTLGKESELGCGEKASAPINIQLSGMIVMAIINYIAERDYVKLFIGNASMPTQNIIKVKEARVTPDDENV